MAHSAINGGKYEEFREIIRHLRSKDGCPWDRVQTHESLKQTIIEEAAELIGGVDAYKETGNPGNLIEEIGDLLMQILMQAEIGEENGVFTMDDAIDGINEKMIRRHPHVFGTEKVGTLEEEREAWHRVKVKEHADKAWLEPYTAGGMEQAIDLIVKAQSRKGFHHRKPLQRIEELNLQKHPEGGWFAEIYTADKNLGTVQNDRPCGGSIYFLLEGNDVSHFHVIDCDELWYHHEGCGVKIHCISCEGEYSVHQMGIGAGMEPMVMIPTGTIFAAECMDEKNYTLMSCATLPAFTYAGFRLVPYEEMIEKYGCENEELFRRLAFAKQDLPQM